jgi:hypothetical protein
MKGRRKRVAYACVQDIPINWQSYEVIRATLVDPEPDGLIAHLAGPTDEGVRIIEIWDTQERWDEFRANRLTPAIQALHVPRRREPTFRALDAKHFILR